MSTVKDVLAGKTTAHVHTIAETASVLDAVTAMNRVPHRLSGGDPRGHDHHQRHHRGAGCDPADRVPKRTSPGSPSATS